MSMYLIELQQKRSPVCTELLFKLEVGCFIRIVLHNYSTINGEHGIRTHGAL